MDTSLLQSICDPLANPLFEKVYFVTEDTYLIVLMLQTAAAEVCELPTQWCLSGDQWDIVLHELTLLEDVTNNKTCSKQPFQ